LLQLEKKWLTKNPFFRLSMMLIVWMLRIHSCLPTIIRLSLWLILACGSKKNNHPKVGRYLSPSTDHTGEALQCKFNPIPPRFPSWYHSLYWQRYLKEWHIRPIFWLCHAIR
jgi:hypothetical protein